MGAVHENQIVLISSSVVIISLEAEKLIPAVSRKTIVGRLRANKLANSKPPNLQAAGLNRRNRLAAVRVRPPGTFCYYKLSERACPYFLSVVA